MSPPAPEPAAIPVRVRIPAKGIRLLYADERWTGRFFDLLNRKFELTEAPTKPLILSLPHAPVRACLKFSVGILRGALLTLELETLPAGIEDKQELRLRVLTIRVSDGTTEGKPTPFEKTSLEELADAVGNALVAFYVAVLHSNTPPPG